MSARETAVLALAALLQSTGADVWRDTDVARPVPPEGLIQLSEGEDQVEAIFSPLRWLHELPCEVIITVTANDEPTRDERMDSILGTLGDLITADRTLGGAVDHCEPGPPSFQAAEIDGAGKSARLTITLSFVSDDTALS